MSGESEDEEAYEWMWAHLLWQKKHLRLEEFASMEKNVRLAYIASEELVMKYPLNATERLAKGFLVKK